MSAQNVQPGLLLDSAKQWSVLTPSNKASAWIPDSFRNSILLHIAKNDVERLNPSLFLAIQGGMGEGKSFQTRETCSQLGVYIIPVPGALLSGSFESEPIQLLKDVYVFASALKSQINSWVTILIDDFDLSSASTFDDRRYTVNTQLLSGFLMSLADDPRRCGEHDVLRIPIILTGNNFTALHPPLTRHGRMKFFHWGPNFDEKVKIVEAMFSRILRASEVRDIPRLVKKFKTQPVSFFSALKDDLVDSAILRFSSRSNVLDLTGFESALDGMLAAATIDQLISLAESRASSSARRYSGGV
jgi:hypothetical protein